MEEIEVFRYILLTFVMGNGKVVTFLLLKSTLCFKIPNRKVIKKWGQQGSTVLFSKKSFLRLPYVVNFQAAVIVRANDTNKWVSDIQVTRLEHLVLDTFEMICFRRSQWPTKA